MVFSKLFLSVLIFCLALFIFTFLGQINKISLENNQIYFEDQFKIKKWEFSDPWREYLITLALSKINENIQNDNQYCEKVKNYQVSKKFEQNDQKLPIFSNRFIFSDYSPESHTKKILNEISNLSNADIYGNMPLRNGVLSEIDPKIEIFFHLKPAWHQFHQINIHFLCENQRYNHIPGNLYLNFKDLTVNSMMKYSEYYKNREKCFDPWQIMPKTFDLHQKDQCKEFITILNETKSSEIEWLLKISRFSHNGEGILLLDPKTSQNILNYPENCPFKNKVIAQKYIKNPLLINSHKFDFRTYLIIASMDPLILLYHDGFIKLSLEPYNSSVFDYEVHLTNTKIQENQKKNNENSEKTSEKSKNQGDLSWSFEKFWEYMQNTHNISEKFAKRIKNQIKTTMLHIVRMNLDKLLHHPGVFEIFGLDFLMDENFKLWYLETNLSPAISESTLEKKIINEKMIKSLIDLEFAFLYHANIDQIISNSNFEWIYDGRISGTSRYCGVLSQQCL